MFTIIRDTREKNGFFDFPIDEKAYGAIKVVDKGLNAGDYTVEGLEDIIRIERKATTGELYNNLGKKHMRKRFHAEMEKLDKVKHSYIVCEFGLSYMYDFPENSTIPDKIRENMRMSGKFFRKLVYEIEDTYNVEILYRDGRKEAEECTLKLLKETWEKYGDK